MTAAGENFDVAEQAVAADFSAVEARLGFEWRGLGDAAVVAEFGAGDPEDVGGEQGIHLEQAAAGDEKVLVGENGVS